MAGFFSHCRSLVFVVLRNKREREVIDAYQRKQHGYYLYESFVLHVNDFYILFLLICKLACKYTYFLIFALFFGYLFGFTLQECVYWVVVGVFYGAVYGCSERFPVF